MKTVQLFLKGYAKVSNRIKKLLTPPIFKKRHLDFLKIYHECVLFSYKTYKENNFAVGTVAPWCSNTTTKCFSTIRDRFPPWRVGKSRWWNFLKMVSSKIRLPAFRRSTIQQKTMNHYHYPHWLGKLAWIF